MPVEEFVTSWYHDHIVFLFIKENNNEQVPAGAKLHRSWQLH